MSMLDKIPEIIIGPSSRLDGRKIAWILCHAPEDAQGMYCTLGYLYYDDEMMWWGLRFFWPSFFKDRVSEMFLGSERLDESKSEFIRCWKYVAANDY